MLSRRPQIEVAIRTGPKDGYESARLDITLSSLQAAQGRGVNLSVTLWLEPGDELDPVCSRFKSLQPKGVVTGSAPPANYSCLAFATSASRPYFSVLEAGCGFPWGVTSAALFDGNKSIIRIKAAPDMSRLSRMAVLVGGVCTPNDINLHEGLFVYSTQLAERAYLLLTSMHGAAFLRNETDLLSVPEAYVAVNDDRLEGWHSIRRSAAVSLPIPSVPDVRGLSRERALDRIYAQLSKTA